MIRRSGEPIGTNMNLVLYRGSIAHTAHRRKRKSNQQFAEISLTIHYSLFTIYYSLFTSTVLVYSRSRHD